MSLAVGIDRTDNTMTMREYYERLGRLFNGIPGTRVFQSCYKEIKDGLTGALM